MAPPVRTPPSQWVDAGLRALATGGPRAVRIDRLAKDLGVTRGGFYGFFKDRQAFLQELLDTWERRSIDETLEQVERGGGDARSKVFRAAVLTFSEELFPVDLAIREWARQDPAVARRLTRVDGMRMDYVRQLLTALAPSDGDIEARSLLAFSLAITTHLIAAVHPDRDRSDVLRAAFEQILR